MMFVNAFAILLEAFFNIFLRTHTHRERERERERERDTKALLYPCCTCTCGVKILEMAGRAYQSEEQE